MSSSTGVQNVDSTRVVILKKNGRQKGNPKVVDKTHHGTWYDTL
jgi:hypothetical protein